MKPWFERHVVPPARAHRKPAQWRDTTDLLQLEYFFTALQQGGAVYAISANLHPDIEAQARLQANPLAWLRRRVAHHLEAGLKRPVDMILVPEEADNHNYRLHLHGALSVRSDEAALARAALRKACGEWEEVRQHQVKTTADPDEGWIGYVGKNLWKTSRFMRVLLERHGSRQAVRFGGSNLSTTNAVRRRAEALYAAHREKVIEAGP